jgi:iron complex outermembrane receptor protein
VIDNIGTLKIISGGFLVNGGYSISNYTELFWTATANERKVWRDNFYRFPKNPSQVNLALYPDGFQAKNNPKTTDISTIAGIKGETKNGERWEVTSSYGRNALRSNTTNNNNASQSFMGKDAPTAFHTGKQVYQQLTNNIYFSKKNMQDAKTH